MQVFELAQERNSAAKARRENPRTIAAATSRWPAGAGSDQPQSLPPARDRNLFLCRGAARCGPRHRPSRSCPARSSCIRRRSARIRKRAAAHAAISRALRRRYVDASCRLAGTRRLGAKCRRRRILQAQPACIGAARRPAGGKEKRAAIYWWLGLIGSALLGTQVSHYRVWMPCTGPTCRRHIRGCSGHQAEPVVVIIALGERAAARQGCGNQSSNCKNANHHDLRGPPYPITRSPE